MSSSLSAGTGTRGRRARTNLPRLHNPDGTINQEVIRTAILEALGPDTLVQINGNRVNARNANTSIDFNLNANEIYVNIMRSNNQNSSSLNGIDQLIHIGEQTGVSRISTFAAGHGTAHTSTMGRSAYQGYRVWPQLGFNAPLSPGESQRFMRDTGSTGRRPSSVVDLQATPEGRRWWRQNGTARAMSFDLSQNNPSRRQLAATQARLDRSRSRSR